MLQPLPQSVSDNATKIQRLLLNSTEQVEGHPGVYTGWGFDNDFDHVFLDTPWFDMRPRSQFATQEEWESEFRAWAQDADRQARVVYGVADSLDQILERLPWLADDEQPYVLVVTLADDPSWRWHKWGEYFGDCTDQGEYLGESGIEQVVTFTVHQYREDVLDGPPHSQ